MEPLSTQKLILLILALPTLLFQKKNITLYALMLLSYKNLVRLSSLDQDGHSFTATGIHITAEMWYYLIYTTCNSCLVSTNRRKSAVETKWRRGTSPKIVDHHVANNKLSSNSNVEVTRIILAIPKGSAVLTIDSKLFLHIQSTSWWDSGDNIDYTHSSL